jgi:protein tyrosine phosphatase
LEPPRYELIPHNNAKFEDLPKLTEFKNRYANILPNKHSRVKLSLSAEDIEDEKEAGPQAVHGEGPSSYINANWWVDLAPKLQIRLRPQQHHIAEVAPRVVASHATSIHIAVPTRDLCRGANWAV